MSETTGNQDPFQVGTKIPFQVGTKIPQWPTKSEESCAPIASLHSHGPLYCKWRALKLQLCSQTTDSGLWEWWRVRLVETKVTSGPNLRYLKWRLRRRPKHCPYFYFVRPWPSGEEELDPQEHLLHLFNRLKFLGYKPVRIVNDFWNIFTAWYVLYRGRDTGETFWALYCHTQRLWWPPAWSLQKIKTWPFELSIVIHNAYDDPRVW